MLSIREFEIGNRAGIVAAGVLNEDEAVLAKRMGADILEIRMDMLDLKEGKIMNLISKLRRSTRLPIIATNRMKAEGGYFDGDEKERLNMLLSVMELVDAVDIELASDDKEIVIDEARRKGKTTIVSYHNFDETPMKEEMLRMIVECHDIGDIAKLSVMAKTREDVLSLLDVCSITDKPSVCISMGKIGRYSRVVAPLYGSVLTYGFIGTEVAPGQLSVEELKRISDIIW
jgi:3-dehydroquinate dehydratase-1